MEHAKRLRKVRRLYILCAALPALLSTASLALAQPTPMPVAQTSPASAQSLPHFIPLSFDPCAGPLELENKLGPTACVLPVGEAMIQGVYQSINVPGSTGASPLGRSFKVPVHAHVTGYPASVFYIGITRRAEIDITPPSFVQVNSTNFGIMASSALDSQLSYKQLLYINLRARTLIAMKLTYKAPTGSPGLRGLGPAYQFNPIIGHRLGPLFGLTLALPVSNAAVQPSPSSGVQRAWSFQPKLLAYWQSPGGTQLVITVQHSFSPNVTPLSFGAMHLLSRHVLVQAQYCGLNFDGPIAALAHATPRAYPHAVFINVYYLIGRSDRPTLLSKPRDG